MILNGFLDINLGFDLKLLSFVEFVGKVIASLLFANGCLKFVMIEKHCSELYEL